MSLIPRDTIFPALLGVTFLAMAFVPRWFCARSDTQNAQIRWIRWTSVLGFCWIGLALIAGPHRNPFGLSEPWVKLIIDSRYHLGGIIVGLLLGFRVGFKARAG